MSRVLFITFLLLAIPSYQPFAQPDSSVVLEPPSIPHVTATVKPQPITPSCSDTIFASANIELCKYLLERENARDQKATTLATVTALFISALVGFGTIVFNIRNAAAQAQLQAKLKALEVVISAAGPNAAKQRLAVVKGILGEDLVPIANEADFEIEGIGVGHDQGRRELLKSLADNPERREQILADWEKVFGSSKMGDQIRGLKQQAVLSKQKPWSPFRPVSHRIR